MIESTTTDLREAAKLLRENTAAGITSPAVGEQLAGWMECAADDLDGVLALPPELRPSDPAEHCEEPDSVRRARALALELLTYTHPDVFTKGVREGWADPITDPAEIDWPARQATAAIPFTVVGGRPVNPCADTAVRYGRNECGHWGEALAADALVSVAFPGGTRRIVMVERDDGHGWALPGGHVDPGEAPLDAAVRELAEETGLRVPADHGWSVGKARYVDDPRSSREAWMVTVLAEADLGVLDVLPRLTGADDAVRAEWVRASSFAGLAGELESLYGGRVFPAHVEMLREALDR